MSVLVFIEIANNSIKKSSLEAAGYASELASKLNVSSNAVAVGKIDGHLLESLGAMAIKKVLHVDQEVQNAQSFSHIVKESASKLNSTVIVLPKSVAVDAFAGRLAVTLKSNLVSNVSELPDLSSGFNVKRSIYTGKAFEIVQMKSSIKILVIKKNAFSFSPISAAAEVSKIEIDTSTSEKLIKVTDKVKATGDILLTEAEIVVSGGRGMKGPENWHLIESLAKKLGAATGCSKPVSDIDWRPHHEHVGQTGVKVSPNIYIAVGISGAIQHLAGVNSSKVIVVINKDPEAPFFKSADYGIVGDAFEVLPKLIAAL